MSNFQIFHMQQRISESPHLSESSEQKIEALATTKAVANADSLSDPRSYAQATEAQDDLRPTLYNIPGASEADVDAAIDGFNTLLSDLRDTQVSGTEDLGTAYEEAFKNFESQLEDALMSISYTGPISVTHADWVLRDRGIRVLGE